MPLPYNGIPSNVQLKPVVGITSVTAGTPIAVGTGSPHNLLTGDWVHISGTAVTQANGIFPVTVTGANSLTLNGSSAGSGSSVTGALQPLAVQTFDTPEDGEDADGASVEVGLAALGDRTALTLVNTGALKLAIDASRTGSQDSTNPLDYTTVWASVAPAGDTNWHPFGTLGPMPWTPEGNFVVGDIVDIDLDLNFTSNSPTGNYALSIWAVSFALGSLPPTGVGPGFAGSFLVPGSAKQCSLVANVPLPVRLSGRFTVGTSGFVWVAVAVNHQGSGSPLVGFTGDYMFRIRSWRATGMAQ